jgi:hypothetical protein
MAGVAGGIQPDGRRAPLDDPRNRFIRKPPRLHALKGVQRAEHRPIGDARRGKPGLERAHRAGGFRGAEGDAEPTALAFLVSLGFSECDDETS